MGRFDKLLLKLLRGTSDASFAFDDLRYVRDVRDLIIGYRLAGEQDEEVRGDHLLER